MNKTFKDNPDYMGGMGDLIRPTQTFKRKMYKIFKHNIFNHFFLIQHDYGNGKFQKSGLPRHPYGTNKFKEVEVLGGCIMSYRKEIFKEFNFDENLIGYSFMEDVDFSRRVSYKYKLFYNPDTKLEHKHASDGCGNVRDNRKMYMVNHRYLFFKNFYSRNKLFILAHWWSLLGLIIHSLIFESKEATKGYFDGLKEFKKRKEELLCN
jgi:GT2 family glycosyltransferase